MKNIYLIMIIGWVMLLSSCYEQTSWVDANVKEGGKYIPFIQTITIANTPENGNFKEGDLAEVRVQYWSVDPVSTLDLYATVNGTRSLASSTPYVFSYDADSGAEIMTLSYTVPAGSSGTTIKLEVSVICENGESRSGSANISVE